VGRPATFQQVQAVSAFLNGKTDPLTGESLYGWLDVYAPWGGFGWYFFASRATAYAKHPDDAAWLFDADTMKPRVNNPAFVRAIQDIKDNLANLPGRPDQRGRQHDRLHRVPDRRSARCARGGATWGRTRRRTTPR
jgi:multiple sugar transport system substrate-binding protein